MVEKIRNAFYYYKLGGVKTVFRKMKYRESYNAEYELFKNAKEEEYPKLLKLCYKQRTGKILNLDNPQSLNEKIQWLKLYDSSPIKTQLADKYLVRRWVEETIGSQYLIPLLGAWSSFEEIDFDELPKQFVLKCNHGSGMNLIVKDKTAVNWTCEKQIFDRWMNTNYAYVAGLELHYRKIKPMIIAEKYMGNIDEVFSEYHLYCFHGQTQLIELLLGEKGNRESSFFDKNWHPVLINNSRFKPLKKNINMPKNLKEILQLSEKLCAGFLFCRVDLYSNGEEIYFGEMTFTPESGFVTYYPESADVELGKLL